MEADGVTGLLLVCGLACAQPLVAVSGGNAVMRSRAPGADARDLAAGRNVLEVSACRGEFESVSLVVYAREDLKGLRVTVSPLWAPGGTIPASAVDVRIVKWWYQGEMRDLERNHPVEASQVRVLTPELLLHDDALVRVDRERQENWLRSTAEDGTETYLMCSGRDSEKLADVRPADSVRLRSVDVGAGRCREFWLNVHVPEHARPGVYVGVVAVTSSAGDARLRMRVTVRSFGLAPSRLIYSLYYRGRLDPARLRQGFRLRGRHSRFGGGVGGQAPIESDLKSVQQYRAEIADMRDHGVLYPTSYQGWGKGLRRALAIRRQEGLPTGRFYTLACGATANAPVREWLDLLGRYGYEQVYFYGADEAEGDALTAQRADWAAVQQAGGKTFVATYHRSRAYEVMGGLLNCAVVSGLPNAEDAARWHAVGSECFAYLCPQVGVEDPVIYRRRFGVALARAGYDGAMDYAYQHAFGHIWNDFDDPEYRDHVFAYPTVNGVVPTVEWEGFREAVDDVRYLTTLEQAIAGARDRGLAVEAQSFTNTLPTADLDADRERMAEWIERLR